MQGKIKGKRNIGKRKILWLRNLREWFSCNSIELFRRATNKIMLAIKILLISNISGFIRKNQSFI